MTRNASARLALLMALGFSPIAACEWTAGGAGLPELSRTERYQAAVLTEMIQLASRDLPPALGGQASFCLTFHMGEWSEPVNDPSPQVLAAVSGRTGEVVVPGSACRRAADPRAETARVVAATGEPAVLIQSDPDPEGGDELFFSNGGYHVRMLWGSLFQCRVARSTDDAVVSCDRTIQF